MEKRCLSCGAQFTLSGSGKRQKYCSNCRKRGMGHDWGLSASNPLKAKGAWGAFSEGIPPSQSSHLTTPDGDKAKLWSSARKDRKGEGAYWKANVRYLLDHPEKHRGFSEPRKATADIIRIEGWSRVPLGRLKPEPPAREPRDVDPDIWPRPWGFKVRLYIEAEKELQELGCGWRDIIVELDGDKVHLHHNGRMATMRRDAFKDFLARNKRFRKRIGMKPQRLAPTRNQPHKRAVKATGYQPNFTETPQGADYPIEMDETGFPIMPACLRRTPQLKLIVSNPPRITIKEEAA